MQQAIDVLWGYAAAFEETYEDDDWTRLAPFFAGDATYEVQGGPLACKISGRDAIFLGLKKSIDGLDRRCSDRQIDITDALSCESVGDGHELTLGWRASYQYGDAPRAGFAGRSVATVRNGVITSLRDEYSDEEMNRFGAWMQEYGQGLDGSYV